MARIRVFVKVIWGSGTGLVWAVWNDCINFVDAHPRTGWYLCVIVTLNLLVQLLDLVAG